jgi:hypothetical protein
VPLLKSAIELANSDGDLDSEYILPNDVVYRKSSMVSAKALIEAYHLHYYINNKESITTMGKMNDLDAQGVTDLHSYLVGRRHEREAIIKFIDLSFDELDTIPASIVLGKLVEALKEQVE